MIPTPIDGEPERPAAMSKENTIVAKRRPDGTLVQMLPDDTTQPFPLDETDWSALRAMSDAEINAAALSDPDNPPWSPERQAHFRRVPQVKVMRRALGLTREEFSARYRIPLSALRDWEEGKAEPDQAARAYLTVIAREPEVVRRALQSQPSSSPT
jgi:putative transcriptional regulator